MDKVYQISCPSCGSLHAPGWIYNHWWRVIFLREGSRKWYCRDCGVEGFGNVVGGMGAEAGGWIDSHPKGTLRIWQESQV